VEVFPPPSTRRRCALHLGTTASRRVRSTSTLDLLAVLTTKWVLDLQPDDIYWCTADPGWVTGTSYGIVGPGSRGRLSACSTRVQRRALYKFIEEHRVTMCTRADGDPAADEGGTSLVRRHDLSSLRHLCSVGEPLNPEAWSGRRRRSADRSTTTSGRPRPARS